MRIPTLSLMLGAGALVVATLGTCLAAPQISEVMGTVAHGQQAQITGAGFGPKSPAKPFLWAPFDGSSSPSPLGIKTSWDAIQNMTYAAGEGYASTGAIKSTGISQTAPNAIWTARVDASGFAWNNYGQKMYLFRRVKRNFDINSSMNWKIFRVWSNVNGANGYPDYYIATSNGDVGVEGVNTTGTYPYGTEVQNPNEPRLAAVRGKANVWRTEEILAKANTSATATDGEFYHYVLGFGLAGKIPYTDYMLHYFRIRDSDSQASMTRAYPIHGVMNNYAADPSWVYWADDVYMDNTWARVMIGNAPKLADCTYLEVQIPYEWGDGKVGVTVNLKSFPESEPRYIFVVDANGAQSTGFLVGGAVAPKPPSDVTID